MKFYQFSEALDVIYPCFGRRPLDENTRDKLFGLVKHIPAPAVEWIRCHIIESFDSLPRNIVWAFRDAHQLWLNTQPSRPSTSHQTNCPTCGGSGELHFRQFSRLTGRPYTVFCLCADCENCFANYPRETILPRFTRADVEAMDGFEYWMGWLAHHDNNAHGYHSSP